MADMKIEYEEVLGRRKGPPPLPTAGRLHTASHARIFGLSLAALMAACLVLNAASPSTRLCQQSDRDFGTTGTDSVSALTRAVPALGGGWHVEPFGTIRSKQCATNQGGEEPGY
jgi:hypothetical protein